MVLIKPKPDEKGFERERKREREETKREIMWETEEQTDRQTDRQTDEIDKGNKKTFWVKWVKADNKLRRKREKKESLA